MGQRGVIQRPCVLANPERLTADLQHQGLRDRVTDLVGRGDPEAGVRQPRDVLVGAGERHRRMNGQRYAVLPAQRRENGDAVGPRGMRHDGARPHRRCGGQSRNQARELGVGHGQQQQLGVAGDVRETALQATTTWSTRSSATPNAVPTRPAEMIPTLSRAGRNPSNCTIADDPHKSLDSFQSRGAGTGRSLRLYPGYHAVGLWPSPQSSRRRRRPPPDGLGCSRANNSATDWPPDGGAEVSNGSVVRCRALGEGGGDITGSRSGGGGGEAGIGGGGVGGGDIAGAGVSVSPTPMPESEYAEFSAE